MVLIAMPHNPEDKKKAITRLRRIRGQAEALERAVENEVDCGQLLQQLAALRGAVNGMIFEILEGHMRETFDTRNMSQKTSNAQIDKGLSEALTLIRSYMK